MKQKRALIYAFYEKFAMAEAGKKWELDPAQKVILIPFFLRKRLFSQKFFFQDQICLCRVWLTYTTFCLNQVAMISTAPHKLFDRMCLWEKNFVIWTSPELDPTQWMIALTVHLSASVIRHVFLWTWPRLEEWTESFGASCSLLTNTETPLNSLETRAPIISSLRLQIFFKDCKCVLLST